MTTAQTRAETGHRTTTVGAVIRGASVATVSTGLLAVLLGALTAGSAAAVGAGIGTVMVTLFFAFGAMVLAVVARLAPAASLLIALLTYTLKVVLVGLVFLGLSRSGALADDVDARWLGGTVIACTLTWLVAQIVLSVRARQPYYELASDRQEASVR